MPEDDAVHFAEHLGCLDTGILHVEVARIPQGRAGALREQAVADGESVADPEGIFSLEGAANRRDAGGLFQRRFAGVDGDTFQIEVVLAIERPFTAKFLIDNMFHI